MAFVPGASASLPAVQRSEEFLERVRKQTRRWTSGRRRSSVRQHLVFTMPENGRRVPARSSLNEAVRLCRKRAGSPDEAWIASPFFDSDSETSAATVALCKLLARGADRHLCFCVPAIQDETAAVPRLAVPRALVDTPPRYSASVSVELLPDHDGDRNLRPWHAKMLALKGDRYSALMVGSSNFTRAGLGVGGRRNTEANLLTLVDYVEFSRDSGELDALWPEMAQVDDAEAAEWEGGRPERDEEERGGRPAGAAGIPVRCLSGGTRAAACSVPGSRRAALQLEHSGEWSRWPRDPVFVDLGTKRSSFDRCTSMVGPAATGEASRSMGKISRLFCH